MLKRFTSDHLGLRLVVLSLLISTALSAIAAALQLYGSYQRQRADLIHVVTEIERAFVPTLQAALWRFDQTQVQIILESIATVEGISYVSLSPQIGNQMFSGVQASQDLVDEIPLSFVTPNGNIQDLGVLRVEASLDTIRDRIWAQFWTLMLSNTGKAYVSATCLLLLFYFLVTRHLRAIGAHIRKTDWLNASCTLTLERNTGEREDELDNITEAINLANYKVCETINDLEMEIETRKQAEQAAIRASEARKEFLATMSHEVRTPLNSIIGTFSLLRLTGITDRQMTYIDNAESAARRLLGQLTNVLEVSKLHAAAIKINYTETNMSELAEDWLKTLNALIHQHGKSIDTSLQLDEALPVMMHVDKVRLTQIVTNLCDNAVRFTHSGQIRINVGPGVDAQRFEVSIEDTGSGIPAQAHTKIFERFSQVEQGYSRGAEGAGLGLSICWDLCELMEGSISVESPLNEGRGTRFTIDLPMKEQSEDDYFIHQTRSAG